MGNIFDNFLSVFVYFLVVINAEYFTNDVTINPRVNLTIGEIEGILFTSTTGKRAYVFQGIPYAEPPTKNLRFAKTVPKSPWNGTLPCNAGYKPACPQNISISQYKIQSEDCLYLNVFSGLQCFDEHSRTLQCPVLYYVHGGACEFESPAMFPLEDLVNNVASQGIVLVTVAYRLGILGFFSTGLEDAPGNWAFQDMIEGAHWVQREIENFGGDPKKVTIMGHSSSSVAVSLLTMSEKTRGLFQRAVLMSGSGTVWNSLWNDVTDYLNLAKVFNCKGENNVSLGILNCLRKIDANFLVNKFMEIRGFGINAVLPRNITQARNDGKTGLFPVPLSQLIAQRRPMDLMLGNTKTEYGLDKMFLLDAGPHTVVKSCYDAVQDQGNIRQKRKISQACIEAYMPKFASKNSTEVKTPEEILNPINETIQFSIWTQKSVAVKEDVEYYAPCHQEVYSMLKNSEKATKVYLYSFDYEKEHLEGIFPWHAADLSFVLGSHKLNGKLSDEDLKVQAVYSPMFMNFVKHGDPTPRQVNGVRWQPLTISSRAPYKYLSVNKVVSMKSGYHEEASTFWNKIVPQLDKERNSPKRRRWRFWDISTKKFYNLSTLSENSLKRMEPTKNNELLVEKSAGNFRTWPLFIGLSLCTALVIFIAMLVGRFRLNRRRGHESIALISSNLENFHRYEAL